MCDRDDWRCFNNAPHAAPRGCVHHGTTDDLGDHGRHSDDSEDDR